MNEENIVQARVVFNTIVLTRKWNANYGGVYVEKKEGVESNPYLINPDIKTVDGRVFTLRNPAFMTREISEYAEKEGMFKFHITSLKLMNPHNEADEFEKKALLQFETGAVKEVSGTELVNNRTYFRYMAPLYIENDCLQCHKHQNYAVGDSTGRHQHKLRHRGPPEKDQVQYHCHRTIRYHHHRAPAGTALFFYVTVDKEA